MAPKKEKKKSSSTVVKECFTSIKPETTLYNFFSDMAKKIDANNKNKKRKNSVEIQNKSFGYYKYIFNILFYKFLIII